MVFIGLSSEMDEKAITARLDDNCSDEVDSDNDPFPYGSQMRQASLETLDRND